MKLNKSFILALSLINLLSFIETTTVNAVENSTDNRLVNEQTLAYFEEENNLVAEFEENFIIEEQFDGITPFASLNISHSSLGSNKFVKSKSSYYFKKGEKVKINSVTWNPSGQKIRLGFVHASSGKKYWTNNFTGGSKVGGTFSLGGPNGEYYIAISTPSSNTKSINVNGSFGF